MLRGRNSRSFVQSCFTSTETVRTTTDGDQAMFYFRSVHSKVLLDQRRDEEPRTAIRISHSSFSSSATLVRRLQNLLPLISLYNSVSVDSCHKRALHHSSERFAAIRVHCNSLTFFCC